MRTRGRAFGLAFLGLAFLLFSEVWYRTGDPARQTHETAGPPGFKERVELTDARRAQIRETRKGYRFLFTTTGAILLVVGAARVLRRSKVNAS